MLCDNPRLGPVIGLLNSTFHEQCTLRPAPSEIVGIVGGRETALRERPNFLGPAIAQQVAMDQVLVCVYHPSTLRFRNRKVEPTSAPPSLARSQDR